MSYLSNYIVTFYFDKKAIALYRVCIGVLQGSSLLLILFLLYTTSLYTELRNYRGLVIIGFTNNLNILVISRDIQQIQQYLEVVQLVYQYQVRSRGIRFVLEKSELLYLTCVHIVPIIVVRLGNNTIALVQEYYFLGIWLDQKLYQRSYLVVIKRKFITQQFVLIRLTISVQGYSLLYTREIYTKVIYSTITYRTRVQYQLSGQIPKGIVRKLALSQSSCLRTITGAYRVILIRLLKAEVATPPIDIYLNKRVIDFEVYLDRIGIGTLIQGIYSKVVVKLK